MRYLNVLAVLWLALGVAAVAQNAPVTLSVPPEVAESGLLKHILPRFALKTSTRVEVVAEDADVVIGAEGVPVFMAAGDGRVYGVTNMAKSDGADRFVDWLTSDIGQRTVASFAPEGASLFVEPQVAAAETETPVFEGDAALGEKLALTHCGRCHVVSEKNRMGGIGSTPSFGALRTLPGWADRFAAFWTLNPHPSFTQVEDITEPFDPARPPAIAPLELTLEEVEAIAAFAASIAPKNLGAAVAVQ